MVLPKLDRNGNRILLHRIADTRPFQYIFNDSIKLLLMTIDASLYTDGCLPGYVFVFDMQSMRFGHIARLSINSIRRFFEYLQEGMPIRLKAIHILNTVWFMDKLLALARPFMSRKIYEMVTMEEKKKKKRRGKERKNQSVFRVSTRFGSLAQLIITTDSLSFTS